MLFPASCTRVNTRIEAWTWLGAAAEGLPIKPFHAASRSFRHNAHKTSAALTCVRCPVMLPLDMLHRGSIYRHTRSSLKVLISLLVLTLSLFPGSGWCEPRSGIAMHGEAFEPQDFAYFPYANPDAPKGGRLTLAMRGTFDSLNPLIVKGVSAEGIRDYVYESLLARAYDEPFSLYG